MVVAADLRHERAWAIYTSWAIPRVWGSALVVLVLLGLAVWGRRRGWTLTWGIAWFFLATLPTSNLIVLINAVFYDHWFLLPGLGFTFVIADGWHRVSTRPSVHRWVRVIGGGALLACSWLTIRSNRIWATPMSLYRHILSLEPGSAKIANNLGMAYADAGQLNEAITLYRRAIELSDEYPQTHHNLGNAYLALNELTRAREEFQRAVEMNPRFHEAWNQLGAVELKRQHLNASLEAFEHARHVFPYDAAAYRGLCAVHLARGDRAAAIAALRRGLEVLPDDAALDTLLAQITASP